MTGYSVCKQDFKINELYCPFCKSDVEIINLNMRIIHLEGEDKTELKIGCRNCNKIFKLKIDEVLDVRFIDEDKIIKVKK